MYNLVVMENFGAWLKRWRKLRQMTQDELAQKAGVSPSYISTLEREQPHSITGARLRPEPDKVESIAKALNAPIDEARLAAGYAPKKVLPSELAIMDFDGFDEEDLQDIAEYVAFKRAQKNKGKNNME